jgi:hypothetical protein
MSTKKWLISFALVALSTGMVFANGTVDDEYGHRGSHGGMGSGGMGYGGYDEIDTETFEGRFTLVDGEYPAIKTEDGETMYLMIHDLLDQDSIPAEGADIKVEAFRSPMSPVHVMVISAEVDGVELVLSDNYGRGGYGRQGMHGGGMHGGDMHGGQRSYGGRGAKPGWGYEEPQGN